MPAPEARGNVRLPRTVRPGVEPSGADDPVSDGAPDPEGYARELSALRRLLDESPVVGRPRREAELADLRRLVERYPREAREFLDGLESGA